MIARLRRTQHGRALQNAYAAPDILRGTPMIGERPIPLEGAVASRRIFSPLAYAYARNLNIVPVAHVEALRLASWFPIVWRRHNSETTLVALRSFLPRIDMQPSGARNNLAALPLLVQAYPIVLDPSAPPHSESSRKLDDVAADTPTDIGASITTVAGQLSLATQLRLQALNLFAEHIGATQALTQTLASRDLFEPWSLKFDVGGMQIDVPDLLIVRQTSFDTGALSPILQQHGVAAAQLIGLHRISLFRAGLLLSAARSALTSADGTHQSDERDEIGDGEKPDVSAKPGSHQ